MDGTSALNLPLIHRLEISAAELEMASGLVGEEARRQERTYRNERPFPTLPGKTVVLVDDGLNSGYSMLAALRFVKKKIPSPSLSPLGSPRKPHARCSLPNPK